MPISLARATRLRARCRGSGGCRFGHLVSCWRTNQLKIQIKFRTCPFWGLRSPDFQAGWPLVKRWEPLSNRMLPLYCHQGSLVGVGVGVITVFTIHADTPKTINGDLKNIRNLQRNIGPAPQNASKYNIWLPAIKCQWHGPARPGPPTCTCLPGETGKLSGLTNDRRTVKLIKSKSEIRTAPINYHNLEIQTSLGPQRLSAAAHYQPHDDSS